MRHPCHLCHPTCHLTATRVACLHYQSMFCHAWTSKDQPASHSSPGERVRGWRSVSLRRLLRSAITEAVTVTLFSFFSVFFNRNKRIRKCAERYFIVLAITRPYSCDLISTYQCRMLLADDTPFVDCKFVCFRIGSVARVDKRSSRGDELRERKTNQV